MNNDHQHRFEPQNHAQTVIEGPQVSKEHTSPFPHLLGERYQIIRLLGKGGMGEVFLAEHVTIGKRFAIKVLHKKLLGDAGIVSRFVQEARAASQLHHPHVVDISDFGYTDESIPFFVMEFLEGQDLAQALAQAGYFSWERAKPILLQMCGAVQAAHQKGIIHRDIKPANCFLVNRMGMPDFVKLLDFGIAKVLDKDEANVPLTTTGSVIGTAKYMSPEQALGETLDVRTDVYSLGVVLYELLTGQVPFSAPNFMGTLSKHITEIPPSLSQIAPKAVIDPELEAVIFKALAKRPTERFASVEQFAEALNCIQPQLTIKVGHLDNSKSSTKSGKRWSLYALSSLIGLSIVILVFAGIRYLPQNKQSIQRWTVPIKPIPVVQKIANVEAKADEQIQEGSEPASAEKSNNEVSEEILVTPKNMQRKKKIETPELPEQLTSAQIHAELKKISPEVRACSGGFPGQKVSVALTISPAGVVTQSSVLGLLSGSSLGRCVENVARKVTFPATKKGQKEIYVFTL